MVSYEIEKKTEEKNLIVGMRKTWTVQKYKLLLNFMKLENSRK